MPKKLLKKVLPHPDRIKGIKALEFLGERLHAPNLWHLNRRSVSRAFAIGLWAMYTPPLPWQQIIAAILAFYLDANLPISVLLVWITNPLTWIPLYYIAYLVGAAAMGKAAFTFTEFSSIFKLETVMDLGAPFLVGCLILMHVGLVVGYFGARWFWRWHVISQWEARRLRRAGNAAGCTCAICTLTKKPLAAV